jgi:hypothetical protein
MLIVEIADIRCSPPDTLADDFSSNTQFSVYPFSEESVGFLVQYNCASFAAIEVGENSLSVSVCSNDHLICDAIGSIVLATLDELIPNIPDEVLFRQVSEASPEFQQLLTFASRRLNHRPDNP